MVRGHGAVLGGAGPWGVVTNLTVKMHRPRQECAESCYTQTTLIWENRWEEDNGLMAEQVTQAYLTWVGSRGHLETFLRSPK